MNQLFEQHILHFKDFTKTIEKDCRDEWPLAGNSYTKGEVIHRGAFGLVRFAEAYYAPFGLFGLETRSCVIKTIYLRRRIQDNSDSLDDISKMVRMFRFYRRTMMELFVLSRCRHANILHSHAVFLDNELGDLHIVLPRLYVLNNLIDMYRERNQSEPISILIIAKILRQLCLALKFLQDACIIHRDVQPENVFLTRGGTVKLGHFGQSNVLERNISSEEADSSLSGFFCSHCLTECQQRKPEKECFSRDQGPYTWVDNAGCKTPVGREEFMCADKIQNLYQGKTIGECLDYSYPSDMWSLGVLVLSMVSYFPNESNHKLPPDFAILMRNQQIPFIWYTSDMLQLRSRLVKSGGDELKLFLSDRLLTVSPDRRATSSSLPETSEMKRWCLSSVEEDSAYIRKHFINEVDFANQSKLEDDGANYNCLESKDIPAEFYWDDTWQTLEEVDFLLRLHPPFLCPSLSDIGLDLTQGSLRGTALEPIKNYEYKFRLSTPAPLLEILYPHIYKQYSFYSTGEESLAPQQLLTPLTLLSQKPNKYNKHFLAITDLFPLDYAIKQMAYELISNKNNAILGRKVTLPTIPPNSPLLPDGFPTSDRFIFVDLGLVVQPSYKEIC